MRNSPTRFRRSRATTAIRIAGASVAVAVATLTFVHLGSVTAAPPTPTLEAFAEEVQISPDAPVQGDTVTVLIAAPGRARVTVQFDGAAVPIFSAPGGAVRALIGTDPDMAAGSHSVRVTAKAANGTIHHFSRMIKLQSGRFAVRSVTLPAHTYALINPKNAAIEREALGPALSRRTPTTLWHGPFQLPSTGVMDSPYGLQGFYNGHRAWWHMGVDFAAPEGDPVTATNDGVVVLARALPLGGTTVVIDHGQGVETEYIHLSAFVVREGDHVEKGTVIARVGATGLVTGPSLHWGLFVNGIPVNPLFWTAAHPGLTAP
jgi:murein DD-endopeptidase MepM/ murein hydrolase activator NlpD